MKGQVEMVGLILITIIAGLSIVFALVFMSAKGNQPDIHETYGESVLASNFVSVLAKTYIKECGVTYSKLVKDCAIDFDISGIHPNEHSTAYRNQMNAQFDNSGRIKCHEPGSTQPYPACRYLNRSAVKILDETLTEWGLSYRFFIQDDDGNHTFNISTGGCGDFSEREAPGIYFVRLFPTPGEALIQLDVCRS